MVALYATAFSSSINLSLSGTTWCSLPSRAGSLPRRFFLCSHERRHGRCPGCSGDSEESVVPAVP